jgi:pyrophosphatase PpaX
MRRALLLDFDGTIVDSLGLIYDCLDRTARELLGRPFPRELWEDHIGIPLHETFALLGEQAVLHAEQLITTYRRKQVECSDGLRPFPDIPETLATLRGRGVKLAIVTTKLKHVAAEHLAAIGLQEYFDLIVGFDDCAAVKPHPEPFRLAMAALELTPEQCAAVGDTTHDIRGARAAGVFAAAATWSGIAVSQLLASRPDRVLRTPADLLDL